MPDARSSSRVATRVGSVSPPEHTAVTTLQHRSDFDRVFRTGRRHRAGGIVVIRTDGPRGGFRYGMVAGKKIGSAVERNRVKRRLRHALRSASIPMGVDAVLIGSREVLTAPFSELVRWLNVALVSGSRQEQTGDTLRSDD